MKQFFRLNHPKYDSEQMHKIANPASALKDIGLPGIICPSCGTWAGSRRPYYPITSLDLRKNLQHGWPIPVNAWFKLVDQVRAELGEDSALTFWPGDKLGTPKVILEATNFPDFLVPFPGQLIVRPAVVEVFMKSKLTGFKAFPMEVHWAEEVTELDLLNSVPELYELMVTGRAWSKSVESYEESRCPICRRPADSSSDKTKIKASNWDGSDFFQIDENPNRVLVTTKISEILAENQFTNYICGPFGAILS
jgi:hypothetical protein